MFRFHHTGLLVRSIKDALEHYRYLFGSCSISKTYSVSAQQVNVCFIQNGDHSFIELIEPSGENSVVHGMLKKNINYYHLAYIVEDIEASVNLLKGLHYKELDYFHSEAFGDRRCIFLFTPEAALIELIEEEKRL